jgi:hypothetical protein
MTMKRWLLLALALALMLPLAFWGWQFATLHTSSGPSPTLARAAKSLYKYDMCAQAYAFPYADASIPFKTDYTFADPFRKTQDTIIPRMLAYNSQTQTINMNVDVVLPQVNTYHLSLTRVHEEDGIFVLLPDQSNHLRRAQIPQFIVASFLHGRLAIVDYTCPQKWIWKEASI